jgi:hypothetical protein
MKEKEIENVLFEQKIETKFKSAINNNNDNSLKTSVNKKEKVSNNLQNLDNLIHFSNNNLKKNILEKNNDISIKKMNN